MHLTHSPQPRKIWNIAYAKFGPRFPIVHALYSISATHRFPESLSHTFFTYWDIYCLKIYNVLHESEYYVKITLANISGIPQDGTCSIGAVWGGMGQGLSHLLTNKFCWPTQKSWPQKFLSQKCSTPRRFDPKNILTPTFIFHYLKIDFSVGGLLFGSI